MKPTDFIIHTYFIWWTIYEKTFNTAL